MNPAVRFGKIPPAELPEIRFRETWVRVKTREHLCSGCGCWFEPGRTDKVYHNERCRLKASRNRRILRETCDQRGTVSADADKCRQLHSIANPHCRSED